MKKIAILVVLLTSFNLLRAQELPLKSRGFKVTVSYSSFGNNDVFRFNELDGAPACDGNSFYSIGATLIKPLNDWLNIEAGLEYSYQEFDLYPEPLPNVDRIPGKESFHLFDIPITAKMRFLRYLFVNGGALLSFDGSSSMPITSQNGLGFVVGVGAQYEFDCGFGLFVNPYYKLRALIGTENHQQHTDESGTRLGLIYHF